MQLVSTPLAWHASFLTNPDCTVAVGLCGLGLYDWLEQRTLMSSLTSAQHNSGWTSARKQPVNWETPQNRRQPSTLPKNTVVGWMLKDALGLGMLRLGTASSDATSWSQWGCLPPRSSARGARGCFLLRCYCSSPATHWRLSPVSWDAVTGVWERPWGIWQLRNGPVVPGDLESSAPGQQVLGSGPVALFGG